MSTYKDILENNLKLDLDSPFDKENNKIDVYSNAYWTADTEEEYKGKEKKIDDYRVDNELFELYCWCDISGFHYWVVQQEEENYVSIDVKLKKSVEEYTENEIEKIKEAIIEADDYFLMELAGK